VADAHLGQVPPAVETAFHAFLETVPRPGDTLLVNGDLFDFWFEYRTVIPRKHFATVARLQGLVSRGVPVTFIGGNHDRWGGDFLRRDLGIGFYAGQAELDLVGRRSFVAHGDGFTEQHWTGALTHRLLRHRATVAVFRALHPTIGFWIADKLSGALADSTKDKAVLDRAEAAQATYARDLLERRPELALVVMAHTHRPRLEQRTDGRAYLNPGAFLDGGRYAIVTPSTIELCRFTG
jgi:UDP-2,3-diacylglucosamine hydrolase